MSESLMPITLRPEQEGDEAFLFAVYASTREEEMNATGWPPVARKGFLTIQFKAMRHGYRKMFPQAEFSIVLLGQQPVGRIIIERSEKEFRVVDIALLLESRGKGIGAQLLRQVLAEAQAAGKPVALTVRQNNRAAHLYQRLGFCYVDQSGIDHAMKWLPKISQPD